MEQSEQPEPKDSQNSEISTEVARRCILERKWTFWMHEPCFDGNYTGSRKPLHDTPIENVEDFWRYFNNIPEPSRFFFQEGERKQVGGVTLEGWSLFEEGILPDWEHPRNKTGSTVTFKSSFSPEEIDIVWRDSLLGLVGGSMLEASHVCGIRVIDRGPNYRLEVWTDTTIPAVISNLKKWFNEEIFNTVQESITCFDTQHVEEEQQKKQPSSTTSKAVDSQQVQNRNSRPRPKSSSGNRRHKTPATAASKSTSQEPDSWNVVSKRRR